MFGRAILVGALALLVATMPSAGQTSTPSTAPAQTNVSPEQAQLVKATEAFVRQLFGWGPDVKVSVGPLASFCGSGILCGSCPGDCG